MFAFVWTYSLFPLLWFAAIIWTVIIALERTPIRMAAVCLHDRRNGAGQYHQPIFSAESRAFLRAFLDEIQGRQLISSWRSAANGIRTTGMELLMNFPIALLAMLIGYILFVPRGGKLPEKAAFFLVFTTILLAAQFRSKRFAEYFPPFAILVCGVCVAGVYDATKPPNCPKNFNARSSHTSTLPKLDAKSRVVDCRRDTRRSVGRRHSALHFLVLQPGRLASLWL